MGGCVPANVAVSRRRSLHRFRVISRVQLDAKLHEVMSRVLKSRPLRTADRRTKELLEGP